MSENQGSKRGKMEEKREELCLKRICRFCMTQEEPLTNIFEKDSPALAENNAVPLPLQIMACVSVEVFYNDGMPRTICGPCRVLMDRSYRFKQICKQSDSALRQYPNTGVWPERIHLPDDIFETIEVPSRKRSLDTEEDSNESFDESPPSPKQAKTYLELTPSTRNKIRNEAKNLKNDKTEPKILNTQVGLNQSTEVNRVLKIERKSTINDGNTEQYVLKEDIFGEYEVKSAISDDNPNKPTVCIETDVFPCDHCDRSFPLQQLLDIHMRRHTRERKYHCDQCSKSFFSKYDLAKHANVHSGEKPFVCVECGKAFARATLLHRHEKVHVDTPKFLCSTCDKTFLSLTELDRHESNHRKTRMFECKECNKTFAYKQGLERHSFVHAEEKPHQCHYCNESFTTDGKLARHIRRHAGSRPYPCRYCPKSFLLSHHLTRHMKTSHANEDLKHQRSNQMIVRGGAVNSANNQAEARRNRHRFQKSEETDEYKCEECDKRFETNDDLIYHSAVHATQSLTCPLCNEKFEDLDVCTEHIKSHTEGEQHPCEFCDLIFNTEEKMLEHSENAHQGEEERIEEEHMLYEDVKEELLEDSESFEDPLRLLNSITNSNKNIKTSNKAGGDAKSKIDQQPVRRSMRSGRKDYAQMLKADAADESEEEQEVDDGQIQDEDSETDTILDDKIKKKAEGGKNPSAEANKSTKSDAPRVLNSSIKSFGNKPEAKKILNQNVKQITKSANPPRLLNPGAAKSDERKKVAAPSIDLPETSTDKSNTTLTLAEDKQSEDVALSAVPAKLTKAQLANVPRQRTEIVKMKIGDKMVKVQKIIMTKSEVEAMARQGKIEMKGGAMVLKQGSKIAKPLPNKAVEETSNPKKDDSTNEKENKDN
uniref:C2h2-type zn-finger protein n=1 Tax=Xenopsylla cheopis TaxID=163159 RepID=A0A6M2DJ74_XENCH